MKPQVTDLLVFDDLSAKQNFANRVPAPGVAPATHRHSERNQDPPRREGQSRGAPARRFAAPLGGDSRHPDDAIREICIQLSIASAKLQVTGPQVFDDLSPKQNFANRVGAKVAAMGTFRLSTARHALNHVMRFTLRNNVQFKRVLHPI
ncbi:hypothetical protein GCM10027157_08290 [Corynebacterium aquatimens]